LGIAACAVLYQCPALAQPRARFATISLNAASLGGIPFACMTAAAISAEVSGPDAVRKASCKL
jgi:hypothetical protein